MIRFFRSVAVHCAVLLASIRLTAAEPEKYVFEKTEMGMAFRVSLYSSSGADGAKAAADAAFAKIAELNAIFSDYEDDSELSRLSRTSGEKVKVSEPLWTVLERAQQLSAESGGAFDITCGPLTSVWRRARRKAELPSAELVQEMRERCGWQKLKLDPVTRTAELTASQMRLDLGSLAKGYAVDAALKVLKDGGHPSALVAGGGDMAAGDPPPGRKGWRIEVAPLEGEAAQNSPVLELSNSGIATSGDTFQRLEMDGKRYSHILDMRTGQPMTDHSVVTVVAPSCFIASLSTLLCVIGPADGQKIAGKWKVSARWQRKPGETVEITETPDWKTLLAPNSNSGK